VIGVLTSSALVDCERTAVLVKQAHPLPVTFHRAFDHVSNLTAALEAVITTGAKRILTSGGAESARDGLLNLKQLGTNAGERILIMPGGGIRSSNVAHIAGSTNVREIHTSLGSSSREFGPAQSALFETAVRNFKRVLDSQYSSN